MIRLLPLLLLLGCASQAPRFQRLYLPGENADRFWVVMDGINIARCWQSVAGPICQHARIAVPDPQPDHLREGPPVKPKIAYPVPPDPPTTD